MKRTICAGALACLCLALVPAGVQACVGDCNADGTVTINELVTGVAIALGKASLVACAAMDVNTDGQVTINELVAAVLGALNGCAGPTITLTGSCAEPGKGNQGLEPCDAGTPIDVFRCDDRTQCLHQQEVEPLAQTTVAAGGGWSAKIPAADASATLIFQASIAKAVIYRTLGFGMVGGSLRAGVARDVTFAAAAITPVTEAAVELLDSDGFENYSDSGAAQVLAVVVQQTASLSFENFTPAAAIAHALQAAKNDPLVLMVLQTARNTPTPTPTATPTATRTPPHSLLLVANGNSETVDVVNAATESIVPVHVGPGPRGMALTPDGMFALVANSGLPPPPAQPCPAQQCPDTVSIIDIASRKVRATIPDFTDAEDDPYYVAVTSDGQFAYITNNLSDSVSVVNFNQALINPGASLVAHIPLGSGAAPVGIVAARHDPYVYVANSVAGTLGVIARSTNEQIVTAPMPGNPRLLALTSDDATLYVTLRGPNGGEVAVVDTARLRTPGETPILKTVPVGSSPTGIAISGDDQTVYVVNTGASTLQVISRIGDVPNKVVSTVPLLSGAQPIAVALSGDARVAYVTNSGQNSVSFVDTRLALSAPQNAIIRTVTVGPSPQSIVALEP